jgi:DNA-binding CsgD family transcriptional regulator
MGVFDMTDQVIASAESRLGDMGAMVRLMQPLNAATPDPILRKRRLVADLCRLIGSQVLAQDSNGQPRLSPRMEQTLRSLLSGDSEKQVAMKLGLSPHTVHVYVKALYKHFNVSSRGELLARWVRD